MSREDTGREGIQAWTNTEQVSLLRLPCPVPPVLWSLVVPPLSGAGPAHSDCALTPGRCEICGYQCRQRASLNWHMKKHTAEVQYNFTCERCGKRFEKLDSVKFHTLKSHPDHKPA